MKKYAVSAVSILLFMLLSTPGITQQQISMAQGSMPWTSKSKEAKKHTAMGFFCMLNVEREQAYQHFKAAVELDPEITVPLTFLANLSHGETKKDFARRAQESVAKKTEGEKLFASLVSEEATPDSRREAWQKLHVLFPNDRTIGHFYAITRANPEERFAAMSEYVQKFPEEAAMYNMLGYYYMNDKKDNAKAKDNFEKYIQLYPNGANPYDSMGEFYLTTGDTANAEKYYNMALEKYPFMPSALEALKKIGDTKKKTEPK